MGGSGDISNGIAKKPFTLLKRGFWAVAAVTRLLSESKKWGEYSLTHAVVARERFELSSTN